MPARNRNQSRAQGGLRSIIESLAGREVDLDEPFGDESGRWSSLAPAAAGTGAAGTAFRSERELADIRAECRGLALENEFAINAIENRISFLVGHGHAYRAAATAGQPEALVAQVQQTIDEFVRVNHWHRRQQEIVRRRDRDGEAFLRLFAAADGLLRVRFVEPEQVSTPAARAGDAAAGFGIVTEPCDVETVLGYYIDGRWVDAAEIQHRKANVDANVKRGLPLLYPVRKNLRRAEKLLRNMSVVAEIQSAIAIIRKHASASRDSIEQFVADGADRSRATPEGTAYYRRYAPGTILDAFAGIDYEFPAAAIDATRYVAVLQAELRAIAARLVMPEFMLSSDASNANYASTMVAEGPASRMFERLQHELVEEDLVVMRRVVAAAVEAGRLPREALAVGIEGLPPSLAVRDRLKEAQADQILVACGAMTPATMALRHGLKP